MDVLYKKTAHPVMSELTLTKRVTVVATLLIF